MVAEEPITMDVVIAARLSQTSAGQTGIDTQDEDAEAWAVSEGHRIVAVVADHKSGAADWMDRKNLRPWLTEPAKLASYQGIVAAKQDRLSRGKWRDEIAIRTWAEDNHKELFIVDTKLHWPPRDVGEQIRWEIDASRARDRWEQDSKQYRRMQAYLRDNDFLVGRPPYGYTVAQKGEHKTLEPDPATAPYVVKMAERCLAGWPLARIATWLDSENMPSPQNGKWTPKSISQILRNPVLTGRRKDSHGKTILRCEPILETKTWKQVQAELDFRTHHHVGPAAANTAMLTNIAVCAKCDGPMYKISSGRWSNGQRKDYRYYRCHGTPKNRSTCGNMIAMAELEAWVRDQMTGPDIGPLPVIEVVCIPGSSHEDEIDEVEDKLRDLDFDDPRFDEKQAALRAERKRLKNLEAEPARLDERETGETVAERWARLDDAQRRDYLLRAGVKVYAAGKSPADGWRLDVERPNVLLR